MVVTACRHWLWIAFNEESAVLYGCLVHAAESWAVIPDKSMRSIVKIEEKEFQIIQSLLETANAKEFVNTIITQSIIDLSTLGGPKVKLGDSRHRLIDGFGRYARPVQTHVCERIPELSDTEWRAAFDFLKDTLGIDFRQASDRLGSFDVFDHPNFVDTGSRVNLQVERELSDEMTTYPERISLHHLKTTEASVMVLVEFKLGADRVFSQLVPLEYGQKRVLKAVSFDFYCMSVFDGSGALMQSEEGPLFLRASLNMSMLGVKRVIHDRLSRSAQGLGTELLDQASQVRTRSTSRSVIGVRNIPFDVHQTQMRALIKRLAPPTGNDRWFPRGVAHEINVISYLNSLLDGARVSAGVIVDPWFGIGTLKRVISRFESLDVSLTVITSLGARNPETNELDPNLLTELQGVLDEFQRDKIPNAAHRLRVINLIDGFEQAFHDRYLLLTPHEGEREVYLLSNSLNRMAGKWPFCVSRLDPAAANDAALYIDGLTEGRDISGSTQPTTSFQWSSYEGR